MVKQCNGGATSFASQVHWSHPVHQTWPTIRFFFILLYLYCVYLYFDLQRFLYLSISSKGSANHQNKKEFSSFLCDPPALNLTLVRPESFHICSFFCLPGKKFPACCRKLVAVPIKHDHLGHEWGWVATEIAFHENFATKMNSSIHKQSAFKDWYRAKLFGTIALASSPPLRLKSAT